MNGTGVGEALEGTDVKVAGAVGPGVMTSTEKLQASSNSALNIKTIIDRYHLRCFIAFSLFTLANRMIYDDA